MSDFAEGRWQGRWIWSQDPGIVRSGALGAARGGRQPSWALLRREFDLGSVPRRAVARLAADSRYVLFVNGIELARGPLRGNLRQLRYDRVDLASALWPGRNVVGVWARFFGRGNAWWAPVPPAGQLGGGAFVFELRLDDELLVSDDRWQAMPGEAWDDLLVEGVTAMPVERCDARRLPPSWNEVGFDASRWKPATLLDANAMGFTGDHRPPSHPYGPLLPRPIALLSGKLREPRSVRFGRAAAADREDQEHPFDLACAAAIQVDPFREAALPLQLPTRSDAPHGVVVDFGEIVAGSVEFEIDAPAGTRIDMAAVEQLDAAGRPVTLGERGGFRYVARGSQDRYETASVYGLRALVLLVRAEGPVTLRRMTIQERLHPRPDGAYFECSDELLNRIHRVGRRTVDLCSHDAYLDCPTREQRAWTGDSVVHQQVDLATNPDWGLARWHVELAASPRPDGMLPMAVAGDLEQGDRAFIPDWALHWLHALHNLYRYTADRELVGRLLPVAERVLRWFEPFASSDGLAAEVTGWVIIEWSSVSVAGKSSVLNALLARGLRDFAEMCEWQGDTGRARWARERYAKLAAGFELFWDVQRSLYIDHVVGGRAGRPVSQHAQAAALAAGLVPRDRWAPVAGAMLDEDRLVHAAWQMASGDSRFPREGEGLLSAGYLYTGPPDPWWDVENEIVRAQPFFRYVVHDALAAIGQQNRIAAACRDWKALLVRCPTSLSESWYGGTTCHAWSATPTCDLVTRTLGVTPAGPGFAGVRVAPRVGDLEWARGSVPTPGGFVHVDVDAERIEIESPLEVQLELPGRARQHLPPGRNLVSLGEGTGAE